MEEVAKRGFDPNLALFRATGEGCLYPSHLAEHMDRGLALVFLVGMAVGKCLYDGILLDVRLASHFVRSALLHQNVDLEDLRSYGKPNTTYCCQHANMPTCQHASLLESRRDQRNRERRRQMMEKC